MTDGQGPVRGSGRSFAEIFPERRGVVLQPGHVDPITGPRCIVKMSEGPSVGRYIIAHTDDVLGEGVEVIVSERTGRVRAKALAPLPVEGVATEEELP